MDRAEVRAFGRLPSQLFLLPGATALTKAALSAWPSSLASSSEITLT